MRGIGWLTILRSPAGTKVELLNDLRFLKNASNPATGSVVIRNMADSELCQVYNYRYDACSVVTPGSVLNTIWEITTDGTPGDTFTLFRPPESDPIAYDADAAAVQTGVETSYGPGLTVVTGGPLPAPVFVEFVGGFAGTNVPIPGFGTVTGADPTITAFQVGGTTGPDTESNPFLPINWDSAPPWGNASAQEAEFMGFWVEDWQGLEAEFERTANQRGWGYGGSNFTPIRPKHLTMTFTVLLAASTERGLQYGFRWLSTQLYGLDSCDHADLVVFDHCPPTVGDQSDWLWWFIRDAGVLSMPQWADIVIDEKNCVLRRVTFVLGARDPHKYRCPVVCTATTTFTVPAPATACAPDYSWSEWFCNDAIDPICCSIAPPGFDFTGRAAIVHILGGDGGAPPMEISFNSQTFRTISIPPGGELIIDSSRHQITFSGDTIGDGSAYVSAAFGSSPVWAELTPFDLNPINVCVRPLRICGLDGSGVLIETVDRV